MKINVELDSKSLTDGLSFHGETYADERVAYKLDELGMVLEDVILELRILDSQVTGRHEASAQTIKKRLDKLGESIGVNLTFEEDE